MHNFHIPLPEGIYGELRAEAERSRRPATAVARLAIEAWLRHRRKAARDQAIAVYAAKFAGTPTDFDQALEAASIEHLVQSEQEER
jgi:thioredoxin-like negative regulator of GroEL